VTTYGEGVDYSYARPDLTALKRALASPAPFAIRYISQGTTGGKNIGPAELDQLHATGFGVGIVWETTAGFMTGGAAQAASDAPRVTQWIAQLGLPAGVRIFFALDVDPTPAQLAASFAYLQRMAAAVGWPRVSGYGSAAAVDYWAARCPAPGGWWQTYAWSGGRVSPNAALWQYQNGQTAINGVQLGGTVDRVRLLVPPASSGLWWPTSGGLVTNDIASILAAIAAVKGDTAYIRTQGVSIANAVAATSRATLAAIAADPAIPITQDQLNAAIANDIDPAVLAAAIASHIPPAVGGDPAAIKAALVEVLIEGTGGTR
jgi:hypothetical protein